MKPFAPAAIALTLTACSAPARAPEPPPVVFVEVMGAMVAPSKADGALWDAALGTDRMAIQPFQEVMSLSANATPVEWAVRGAKIGAVVAAAGVQHLARPDPYGWAVIESPGTMPERVDLFSPSGQIIQDDFHASFRSARFSPVALQNGVRITVHLTDSDSGNADDEIGTVILTADDLRAALDLGKGRVVPVLVGEQGAHQIAYVEVAVTRLR